MTANNPCDLIRGMFEASKKKYEGQSEYLRESNFYSFLHSCAKRAACEDFDFYALPFSVAGNFFSLLCAKRAKGVKLSDFEPVLSKEEFEELLKKAWERYEAGRTQKEGKRPKIKKEKNAAKEARRVELDKIFRSIEAKEYSQSDLKDWLSAQKVKEDDEVNIAYNTIKYRILDFILCNGLEPGKYIRRKLVIGNPPITYFSREIVDMAKKAGYLKNNNIPKGWLSAKRLSASYVGRPETIEGELIQIAECIARRDGAEINKLYGRFRSSNGFYALRFHPDVVEEAIKRAALIRKRKQGF